MVALETQEMIHIWRWNRPFFQKSRKFDRTNSDFSHRRTTLWCWKLRKLSIFGVGIDRFVRRAVSLVERIRIFRIEGQRVVVLETQEMIHIWRWNRPFWQKSRKFDRTNSDFSHRRTRGGAGNSGNYPYFWAVSLIERTQHLTELEIILHKLSHGWFRFVLITNLLFQYQSHTNPLNVWNFIFKVKCKDLFCAYRVLDALGSVFVSIP